MDAMKLVDDKILALKDWYERMDSTRSLLRDKYELTDFDGRTVIAQAISVTLNTAKWQAVTLSNKLMKLKWQTVVSGSKKLSVNRITSLESFSDDVWLQINEFLADKYGMSGGLEAWLSKHVIGTGPIGCRFWLYFDEPGNLIIDTLPVDMRWCPFELNEWYCHITRRDAEDIKKEYSDSQEAGELNGLNLEVRDFWDSAHEEVYVSGRKIAEKANIFGSPPFVVILPSSGFMFRDAGYFKDEAEDALFQDRDLFNEQNRAASIAQSMAMDTIKPGVYQPSKNKSDEPDHFPMPGESGRVAEGEEFQVVKRGDLNNAFLKSSQVIDQAVARGGVTDVEGGTYDGNLTYVTFRYELLMDKLSPMISALVAFRIKSMRKILDQYDKLSKMPKFKTEVDLGITGMKHKYTVEQLGDPATYRIDYRANVTSKEQDIANISQANAQKGLVPLRFILEHTLQVADPDMILREMEIERWKEADSSIGMFEGALRYAEEMENLSGVDAQAKEEMSRNLTEMGVLLRRQRRQQASPLSESARVPQVEPSRPNLQGLQAIGGGQVGQRGGDGQRGMLKMTRGGQ